MGHDRQQIRDFVEEDFPLLKMQFWNPKFFQQVIENTSLICYTVWNSMRKTVQLFLDMYYKVWTNEKVIQIVKQFNWDRDTMSIYYTQTELEQSCES